MNNFELEKILNTELQSNKISDYAPNGLQIEGKKEIKKIVTGVTACLPLIEKAIELKADAILVHHGYFWKNEETTIKGMKARRIKALLENNINLYAYHLPLDMHPTLGNNAMLAKKLNLTNLQYLENGLIIGGDLPTSLESKDLAQKLEQILDHTPLVCDEFVYPFTNKKITSLAITSGGGQNFINQALNAGFDAFLSGEISEHTTHYSREQGIYFYACGHHATEKFGIIALGDWLKENHKFDVTFIDIPNPA